MNKEMTLFVKAGCPWCVEVETYLDQKGLPHKKHDVRSNAAAMKEMVALSGQTKAPTMKLGNVVLADFGLDELIPFLKKNGVAV